jgi:glycosyltransferase involved in cell wall biosynthesis
MLNLKLSIVTPSFNQVGFLKSTLDSVISQRYPNLEYIVIDGGSSDGSVEVIKQYESSLAFWVSEKDSGQAEAVNKGLKRATGDIIGWINSDDVYLPGAFAAVIERFEGHPDVDVVYGDFDYIDAQGRTLLHKKEIPVDFRIMLYGRNHVCQPTVFLRRSVLERAGYLDPALHFSLDWQWYLRMFQSGCKFDQIRVPLAGYRWQADSKSVSNVAGAVKERRQLQRKYLREQLGIQNPRWANACIAILDKVFRAYWQLKKLLIRGQFDLIKQRRILNRDYVRCQSPN